MKVKPALLWRQQTWRCSLEFTQLHFSLPLALYFLTMLPFRMVLCVLLEVCDLVFFFFFNFFFFGVFVFWLQ